MPVNAAPTATPVIPSSLIGVSRTRADPNSSSNVAVTPKAPPYTPISSPSKRTFSSSRSLTRNASRIASKYVVVCAFKDPPPYSRTHPFIVLCSQARHLVLMIPLRRQLLFGKYVVSLLLDLLRLL